jgi:hypothetical protein
MAAQAAVARRHGWPYVIPATAAEDLLATERPWVFAARSAGRDEEEIAYGTARAALEALGRARAMHAEALRRAFADALAHDRPAP